jgi:hypothetical protein
MDANGATYAASFALWDNKCGPVNGADPQLRCSEANSLLTWHLLRFASGRAKAYDCAGSIIQRIEHFFRGFGGELVPYNLILKLPRSVRAG